MEVYEKPTAILVSLLGCEAFRELLTSVLHNILYGNIFYVIIPVEYVAKNLYLP